MAKKLAIILGLIFFLNYLLADLLILKDGAEISGKIIEYDGENIVFFDHENNKKVTFPKSKLSRLDVFKEYAEPGVYKLNDIKNKKLKKILLKNNKYSKFSKYSAVNILRDVELVFNKDGKAKLRVHILSKVLKEAGKSIGTFYISYIPGRSKYKLLYARSITNGHIVYANDYSVVESHEYAYYPLYDKKRIIKVIIPKVEIGSFVDYCYEITYFNKNILDNPYFFNFLFTSKFPLLDANIKIVIPEGMKFNYDFKKNKNIGVFSKKVVNSKKYGGKVLLLNVKVKNYIPFKSENLTPPLKESYTYLDISPAYTYKEISNELNKKFGKYKITPKIKALFNEIVKNAKTTDEKIHLIYKYILREIKNAPVSLDDFQYYPLNPEKIIEIKQASQIDKTFLAKLLLECAGINSKFVLTINKRMNCKLSKKVPNIFNFNDAILKLKNGKFLYFGYSNKKMFDIPESLQGTEALVVGKYDNPIIKIPFIYTTNFETYNMVLDKTGTLKVLAEFTGNYMADFRKFYYYFKEELDKEIEGIVNNIHPNAELLKYELKNLSDFSKDVIVKYEYSVKNFPKKSGDMMALNIHNFYLFNASSVAKKKRVFPIFFNNKIDYKWEYFIKLPEDYTIVYKPNNVLFKIGNDMIFKANFKLNNNILKISISYIRDKIRIPVKKYSKYRDFINSVVNFQKEWILLKRNDNK